MTSVCLPSIKVVIPARYASTRLPGKPLINLAGKPMIVQVADRVCAALPSADVWVATDHEEVFNQVVDHGHQSAMTSSNHASGTDRIAELAEREGWASDTVVINVQGDEPLIEQQLLADFAQFCLRQDSFTMASVMGGLTNIDEIHNPNIVKVVVNNKGHAMYFSRAPIPWVRDGAKEAWPVASFYRHVGIYAYNVVSLRVLAKAKSTVLESLECLEQLRALEHGLVIAMMHWKGDIEGGVDTPEDVLRVTKQLR